MNNQKDLNQDVIIPSTQKPKTNLLFPVFIFLILLLSFSLIYFGYQTSLTRKEKTPFPTSAPSLQPAACILGIKLDQCCSCPEPVMRENLSKNMIEYEPGKDYSQAKQISCKDVVCSPCEPLSKAVYVQGQCQSANQTANWKTYQVLDSNGSPLGIEYKLPSALSPITLEPNDLPRGANRYQRYLLPNGTDFVVYPIGKLGIFTSTFEQFVNVIDSYKLKQKTTTLNGKPALEFYGSIENQQTNTDLLILGQGENEFRGVISKIDERSFLYILHFQDKYTPPPGCKYDFVQCFKAPCPPILECPSPEQKNFKKDFAVDEELFDQILSTFKFLD